MIDFPDETKNYFAEQIAVATKTKKSPRQRKYQAPNGKPEPPHDKAGVSDAVDVQVIRGVGGQDVQVARGPSEIESLTLKLHDLNRERREIFEARFAVIDAQREIAEAKEALADAKDCHKEALIHLQRIIDAQANGQKGLFDKEKSVEPQAAKPVDPREAPKPKPPTEPAPHEPEVPEVPEPEPDSEPAEEPETEPAPQRAMTRDMNAIVDEFPSATPGRMKALIAAGIEHVWQLEAAIADGRFAKLEERGLGPTGKQRLMEDLKRYRDEHPIDDFVPEPGPVGFHRQQAEQAAEAQDSPEFEEIPEEFEELTEESAGDDSDVTPVVEDMTDEVAQIPPENYGEGTQASPDDDEETVVEEMDSLEAPTQERGSNASTRDIDPGELSDSLAGILIYVPESEVLAGWSPKERRQVYDWAVDVSDAADTPEGDVPGWPKAIERWLRKPQMEQGMVAWLRERRAAERH
jgi:hypothetical protein